MNTFSYNEAKTPYELGGFQKAPNFNLSIFLSLVHQIIGVSILRAGETMEPALMEVCKDIRLGKILIQTNLDTGEPEVCQNHGGNAGHRID